MSKSAKKKKRYTWCKLVILVLCVFIGRSLWRIPRTTWSPKDSSQTATTLENVSQAVARAKEIRRIVLISIDTLRADHLGCYGYSRNTSPNIDALAAEGILFNHAVSPVPLTLPAHSSMMTGTNPYYHQVHDNLDSRLSDSNITLAEILKKNGFVTGAIIAAFALDSLFGLDQGFDTYDDDIDTAGQTSELLPFSNERKGEEVTKLAEAWLEEHQAEKFFLWLHYYDPHHPYQWHKGTRFKYPYLFPRVVDAYDSEIAYTDVHVGIVIDRLKQMGLYDSTLIIVVGDHGESLWAHKESGHGFFVYHATVHVPFIIKLPGLSAGVKINDVVGLIDIVPTVCQLLGIDPPAEVEGVSLLANSRQDDHRALYCESMKPTVYKGQSLLGLTTNRYKYIHTTRPELYDLYDDPDETDNVVDEHPEIAKMFEDRLFMMVSGIDDRPSGSKIELDIGSLKRLEALGYAGEAVEVDFDLAGTKEDPKDIIDFHEYWERVFHWISNNEWTKAKVHVLEVIAQRPEFYDSIMPAVAYAIATDSDPEVRDAEMAVTIARHGVELTEYRDSYNLRALTAAYDAAGRDEEARKIAIKLINLVAENKKKTKDSDIPTNASPGDPLNIGD